MNQEEQAKLLSEWLARPGESPPSDLDDDVVEAIVSLRPDLAPAPRVSADDILGLVETGPLAEGTPAPAAETGGGGDVVPFPGGPSVPAPAEPEVAAGGSPARRKRPWLRVLLGGGAAGGIALAATALFAVQMSLQAPMDSTSTLIDAPQEREAAGRPASQPAGTETVPEVPATEDLADEVTETEEQMAAGEAAEEPVEPEPEPAPMAPAPRPRPRARPAPSPAPIPRQPTLDGGGQPAPMAGASGRQSRASGAKDAEASRDRLEKQKPKEEQQAQKEQERRVTEEKTADGTVHQSADPQGTTIPELSSSLNELGYVDDLDAVTGADAPAPGPVDLDLAAGDAVPAAVPLDDAEEDEAEPSPEPPAREQDDARMETVETISRGARQDQPKKEGGGGLFGVSKRKKSSAAPMADAEPVPMTESPPAPVRPSISVGDSWKSGLDGETIQGVEDARQRAQQLATKGQYVEAGDALLAAMGGPAAASQVLALEGGRYYLAAGDAGRAEGAAQRGLGLGGSGTVRQALYVLLGDARQRLGDSTGAGEAWEQARSGG